MTQGFSEKEILIELMKETKVQSHILSTLVEKTSSIELQTIKTNGRVTNLEGRANKIETKQENLGVKVAAGVTLLTMAVSAVISRFI